MSHCSMDMSEEDLKMTSALSFSPINQRSALTGFPPSLRLSHIANNILYTNNNIDVKIDISVYIFSLAVIMRKHHITN